MLILRYFIFGYLLFTKFFSLENVPIAVLDRLTVYMAVGTIVGARLGHCLLYQPDVYLRNPIEIMMIWQGGLASHGGAIGIFLALFFFSRKQKLSLLCVVDRIVITGALGGFFIRMGNLMNSEIYGHETNLPWGFIFQRVGETIPKHPTQIYEALANLVIFGILLRLYYKQNRKPKEGLLFGIFLILFFTARFLIEFIKNEQVAFEKSMVVNMGQLLSIPFIFGGIILIYFTTRKKNPEFVG